MTRCRICSYEMPEAARFCGGWGAPAEVNTSGPIMTVAPAATPKPEQGQFASGALVAGGWGFSGITTLRSRYPFSVSSGSDRVHAGLGSNFADLVGNPFLSTNRSRRGLIS